MWADGAVRPEQRFDVIERRLFIVEVLCGESGLCHALNLAIVGRFVKYHIVIGFELKPSYFAQAVKNLQNVGRGGSSAALLDLMEAS